MFNIFQRQQLICHNISSHIINKYKIDYGRRRAICLFIVIRLCDRMTNTQCLNYLSLFYYKIRRSNGLSTEAHDTSVTHYITSY